MRSHTRTSAVLALAALAAAGPWTFSCRKAGESECDAIANRSFLQSAPMPDPGAVTLSPCDKTIKKPEEFIYGTANDNLEQMDLRRNFSWIRYPIRWSHVMPTIGAAPTLTVEQVDADPQLRAQFVAGLDWTKPDAELKRYVDNGFKLLVGIAYGGGGDTPLLNGTPVYPDRIGKDQYIAAQYMISRAIVNRYKSAANNPHGIVIKYWMTECELNEAAFVTLAGWRYPQGVQGLLSSAWADHAFLTQHLATLYRAVKTEDPDAVTMINLHTDLHPKLSKFVGRPNWLQTAAQWRNLTDVLGFDTYPNYQRPLPVRGNWVGEKARAIKNVACPGQAVVVMESGYPAGPKYRGFSFANQLDYLQTAYCTSLRAGVDGFMPFNAGKEGGEGTPASDADMIKYNQVVDAFEAGDMATIVSLYTSDSAWMTTTFPAIVGAVEGHWGPYTVDGEPTPSSRYLDSLGELYKKQ